MFSKNLTKHFTGFGSGFTELHAKLDSDTLLNFAVHHRRNKTEVKTNTSVKAMCVHSTVLHGRLMQ
jgi:hypothetical protein